MKPKNKDAFILVLIGLGLIAVLLLILVNLPLIIWAIMAIIAIIIFVVVILTILGFIVSIPFYFLRKGDDDQGANYKLEDVKPVENEKKN